jgi:O-antigen/teichoic acid export membrane protein
MIQSLLTRIRNDQNLKSMLKNSGVMYASGMFSTLLIAIQQVTTANRIGPEDYGRFATIFGISSLVFLIVDVRTWELATKMLARPLLDKQHEEVSRITTWLTLVDIFTGVLSVICVLLVAQPIAIHLLRAPELANLVGLYALSLPFRMLANGVSRTLLRMYDRYDWLSLKSIVYGVSRLVFISGAAWLGLGLQGVVAGAVLAELIGAMVLLVMEWLIFRRMMPGTPIFNLKRPQQFWEGLRMMRGLWLSATLWGLEVEMYVPLLAFLVSPEQVGIFRSGLDIAETIEKLLVPFMLVLFPQIVKSYEQDTRNQFLRLVKQSALLMALLTIPVLLGIIFLGPLVLPRLLSEAYAGVVIVASLIAAGFTVYGIMMWTRPALVALNRIYELNIIGIAVISCSVAALLFLAPHYGAIGGAAVRGGAMVLQYGLSLLVFRRVIARQKLPHELLRT